MFYSEFPKPLSKMHIEDENFCRSCLARRRRRHRRKREKKRRRRRRSLEAVNRRQRLRRNHLWNSDGLPEARRRAKRLRSWLQAIRATKFALGRTSEYMTSKNKRKVDDINTIIGQNVVTLPNLGSLLSSLYHVFFYRISRVPPRSSLSHTHLLDVLLRLNVRRVFLSAFSEVCI